MILINRPATRTRRALKARHFSDADFLIKEVAGRLVDRMFDTMRRFERIVILGAQHGLLADALHAAGVHTPPVVTIADHPGAFGNADINCVVADEDQLPVAPNSCDLVLSLFNLHMLNDIPGALVQIRRALVPDGLFLGVMPGGDSYLGLRESLMHAELDLLGGASMRMLPSIDLQTAAGLMQRAEFALPVCDLDRITLDYGDPLSLMRDLSQMGQVPVLTEQPQSIFSRRLMLSVAQHYMARTGQDDGRLREHLDLIFFSGWCPDSSQQKPLKPGSAKARMLDALNPESNL